MKETSKVQSRRDAIKLSSQQCKYYLETIIPLADNLDSSLSQHSIDLDNIFSTTVDGKSIQVKTNNGYNAKAFLNQIIDTECIADIVILFNYLEAFSTYFTSRSADEKAAYNTVGTTFLKTAHRILPILLPVSDNENYKNTVSLFLLWEARKSSEKLKLQEEKIAAKLKNRQFDFPRPFGAD